MIADRDFTRRMLQTVAAVTAAATLVVVVYAARDALMLIYISGLIAMGFAPLVRILEQPQGARPARRGVRRTLAIFAIYLAIIGAFVLIAMTVVPPLVTQTRELGGVIPKMFDDFQRFLLRYKLMGRPVTLQEAVQNAPPGTAGNGMITAVSAISSVIGGVFGIVTVLILSFYLLTEAEEIFNYMMRFIPAPKRERVGIASREAVRKVSAWLRAQMLLAAVMGLFAAVGLWLMGEPYFYVIALIAAAGETIPIVGPIIGGLTAVAVALSVSTELAITVGIYFLILHELEANVLVPKIMGRHVGVSPVVVIVALLIGGSLFGLIGAILAIPTAAILAVIVDELATTHPVVEP